MTDNDSKLKSTFLPLLSSEPAEHVAETLLLFKNALPNERVCLVDDLTPAQLASVDVAIAANPPPALLEQLPNLVWLQSLWAGVEQLIAPARAKQLQLVRLIDPELTRAMAEAALAWTLYLHRLMPEYAQQQRQQHWQPLPWRRANDCRVTVLGLGKLGRACAERLAANGFNVAGWSTSPRTLPGIQCYSGPAQLDEALQHTDILLVLLPLTDQTTALLNATTLSLLPKGAALINFARGAIVNTNDLLNALDTEQLRHAVLDVFETEPLPTEHRLWTHPSVTVLPHIAAPTDPHSAVQIAAANITNYRQTGETPTSVDLERGF